MQNFPEDDDDGVELCPVPMDRDTRRRLVLLSRLAGKAPLEMAAELLRDVLEDDEVAHRGSRALGLTAATPTEGAA